MRLFDEIKRRGVLKVAATYLVVSWLVLEVGHLLTLILELPHPTMRFVLGALVLGFPLVLGLAWSFRVKGGALVREVDLPETDPAAYAENSLHAAHAAHAGHGGHGGGDGVDPLPIIVGVLTIGALVLFFVIKQVDGSAGHGSTDTHAAPHDDKASAATGVDKAIAAAPVRAAPGNSIAVLPFDNLSGDPAKAYFSDGMAEELRSALSGVGGLQVAARTSSNAFRNSTDDVKTIAGKLGVAYVIDGSVRRDRQMVRIASQLIEAKSGFTQWSESFDRRDDGSFAMQSDIAKRVTDALKVKLLPQEAALLAQRGTTSAAAHDAYLRGRQLFDLSGDEATYRSALAQYDAAIAADGGYAAAHAARAATLSVIASQFLPTAPQVSAMQATALAAAKRAVALAPGLPATQSALGYVLFQSGAGLAAAGAAYQRSIAAGGGGDAETLLRYGLFNVLGGDPETGLAALRKSVALDRFNPRALRQLGQGLFYARRYADALPIQRDTVRLSPGIGSGHAVIGDTLLMLGKPAEARVEYLAERTRWHSLRGLAIAERRLGHAAAAEAAFKALVAEDGDAAIYQQAQVRAQWGDADGALAALDRALTIGDAGFYYIRQDPLLDPLRGDPRFKALLARWAAR